MNLFLDKSSCCGCTACASICPKNAIIMKNDASGFAYPEVVESLCVECGLCKKVCPFNADVIDNTIQKAPKVYAVINKNKDIHIKSSSGGLFFALASAVINQNGVVYGAVFDESFKVKHIRATDLSGIESMCGSKYVQSNIEGIYSSVKSDLLALKQVMFVGTGCQIGGLKKYLGKRYDNLITVDLVCHGVPSQKHFDGYKALLEKKYKSKIISFKFRAKKIKGQTQDNEVIFENGKILSEYPDLDKYRCLYVKGLTLRPSCFECPYSTDKRVGDITIGDFWGIEKSMPEFKNPLGNSLAIISTKRGEKLFNSVKAQLEIRTSNIENALQPRLVQPFKKPENYSEFTSDFEKNGYEYINKKYKLVPLTKKIKRKIKRSLSFL